MSSASILFHLWHQRDRNFPFLSAFWMRTWGKRLCQIPILWRQVRAQRFLKKAGSRVSVSAFFSNVHQISGQLEQLSIGEETFVGRVELSVHAPVTIGQRVCINDGAKILTASHDVRHPNWITVAKPIVIEDYVWIATNAIVLPGVTIGRGAVIAAGAVISRDVPAGAVAVGNPAQLLLDRRALNLNYSPTAHLALYTAWKKLDATHGVGE